MRRIVAAGCGLVFSMVLFAAGCGGSGATSASACEATCAAAVMQNCDGAAGTDCAASCAAWQQIADAAGCSAEATALYDCRSAQSDVCQAFADGAPCGYAQGEPGHAFEACVTPYCKAHQAQCDAANSL